MKRKERRRKGREGRKRRPRCLLVRGVWSWSWFFTVSYDATLLGCESHCYVIVMLYRS
jgi:hypothetical protein